MWKGVQGSDLPLPDIIKPPHASSALLAVLNSYIVEDNALGAS